MNHLVFAPGDMEKNARRCIVTFDGPHLRLIIEGLPDYYEEDAPLQFKSCLRVKSVSQDFVSRFAEGSEPGITTIELMDIDSWAEENTVTIRDMLLEHGGATREAEADVEEDHVNFPCSCMPNQAGCLQPGCEGEWA